MWAFAGSIIAVAWSTSLTNVKTRCFSQSECVHNIDVIILWSYCNRGSHWKDKVAIHENCIRIIVVISKKIKCLTFSEILYCSINLLNNLVQVHQKLRNCNNISPLAYFPLRIFRTTWIAAPKTANHIARIHSNWNNLLQLYIALAIKKFGPESTISREPCFAWLLFILLFWYSMPKIDEAANEPDPIISQWAHVAVLFLRSSTGVPKTEKL